MPRVFNSRLTKKRMLSLKSMEDKSFIVWTNKKVDGIEPPKNQLIRWFNIRKAPQQLTCRLIGLYHNFALVPLGWLIESEAYRKRRCSLTTTKVVEFPVVRLSILMVGLFIEVVHLLDIKHSQWILLKVSILYIGDSRVSAGHSVRKMRGPFLASLVSFLLIVVSSNCVKLSHRCFRRIRSII